MLRLLAPLFGTLICCSAAALAAAPQRECPVEDFDFAQRLEAVRSAPSCEVAVELFGLCGSAAGSVDMGEVVVAKCEGEFVSRLSKGRLSEYRRAQSRARKHGAEEPRTSKVNSYVCFDTDNHHYCGGCSCGGGRDEARGPTRSRRLHSSSADNWAWPADLEDVRPLSASRSSRPSGGSTRASHLPLTSSCTFHSLCFWQ